MTAIFDPAISNPAFFGKSTPQSLLQQYGSPLYVYNERILRSRCSEMASLLPAKGFRASYSVKANANTTLLRIVRAMGLHGDATSEGELRLLLHVGFSAEEVFFIPNNISKRELSFALDRKICTSADSLSQLQAIGELAPGSAVAIRFNSGIGAGHHQKVVTGGPGSKFGVDPRDSNEVQAILLRHKLRLVGIHHHIGSQFMNPEPFFAGAKALFAIARRFEGLEFVDLGGGFGIPYRKSSGEAPFDLAKLRDGLVLLQMELRDACGKEVVLRIEPGRYIAAECGVLLGTVHATKSSYGVRYIGTDLGFTTFMRPALYDAHHDIEVYPAMARDQATREIVSIVGNICESGDVLAKDRLLPAISEGDVLCVRDAGAYGYVLASNYNCRPRPAEVLIREDGDAVCIRRAETFEDLMRLFDSEG